MKASVRDHIEQLDVSKGGGIVSDKIRVDTIDNPMLVIGLGGTGIDALLRLKHQINRRFKLPEDPLTKRTKDKPDNIEFLGLETNENEKNKRYDGNGVNKEGNGIGLDPLTEFLLLANSEIGSVLKNRSLIEPYIKEWLSPELSIGQGGDNGASGKRQAGRLLLFTKINQVVQTIERKIKTLSVGTSKKLNVFILAGISGGTGSGTFLDIAYIVRGIMDREYGDKGGDKVNILGYLFTPDVNLSNKSIGEHEREYIKKNGYAALKELDYWMNAEERGERFEQQYGSVLKVQSGRAPFNLCHLISARNLDGKLLENAYDYSMNVAAENITNFMASEERHSGQEFAIHDYISNIQTNIDQMEKPFAANYTYNILGASSAVLPIEEMTTYLAYRVFKSMEKMFKATPIREDITNFVNRLGLETDDVHREFNKALPEPIPGYQHSERLSYNNVIGQQIVSIDTELEQNYLSRAREEYIRARRELPVRIMEQFQEQVTRMFRQPDQGPYYVNRIIVNHNGFCLLEHLKISKESLQSQHYRMQRDIDSARELAFGRLAEAKATKLFGKDGKKNAYIEAKINEYQLRADQLRLEQMIDLYEELHMKVLEENNRIYSIFTELLNKLSDVFQNNAEILTNGQEEVDHKGNRTYYWNVVSVPDVVGMFSKVLDEKNVDSLIADFTNDLLTKSDKWLREQELDIVGSISEFLSDQFGDLITRSMEDYLVMKYGGDSAIDRLVETKIASRLYEEARPVFHLTNSMGNYNFPSWGFVSVPVQAPNIFKGIKNFQDNAIANSKFTVKESAVRNRIFWLNTQNGIPLYLYTDLRQYEESYERTILDSEGVGRHLVQNPANSWVNLPSPIPEQSWGDVYVNQRVKKRNADIRQLFEDAQKYGVIREKGPDSGASNRFEVVVTEAFHLDSHAASFGWQKDAVKPNAGELRRYAVELKRLATQGLGEIDRRDIFNSSNISLAKENLIRYPQLLSIVKSELEKYAQLRGRLAELEALLGNQQDEEKQLQRFIDFMYTDTIVRKGGLYVYDHDVNEDAWEPFINLMQAGKYIEFEIYSKVKALDEQRFGKLVKKAEKRSMELVSPDNVEKLIAKLRSMSAAFQDNKATLDYGRDELPNGEEVYSFYKDAFIKLQDLLQKLQ